MGGLRTVNTQRMREQLNRAFAYPACTPAGDDPAQWLTDKVQFYEAEVSRLEAQLKHVKVLLKGHQSWLADVERRKGAK